MTYKQFCQRIKQEGWTLAQIRCDVPPSQELLDFIEEAGDDYERFVLHPKVNRQPKFIPNRPGFSRR